MDILGLIAVLCFGLTCFGIGYTFGKDSNKTQKQPPQPGKLSGYHLFKNAGLTVIVGGSILFYSIDGFLENINMNFMDFPLVFPLALAVAGAFFLLPENL